MRVNKKLFYLGPALMMVLALASCGEKGIDRLSFQLAGSGDSSYAWSSSVTPPELLVMEGGPSASGAQYNFEFVGGEPGEGTLVLEYADPSQPGRPAITRTYDLRVNRDKTITTLRTVVENHDYEDISTGSGEPYVSLYQSVMMDGNGPTGEWTTAMAPEGVLLEVGRAKLEERMAELYGEGMYVVEEEMPGGRMYYYIGQAPGDVTLTFTYTEGKKSAVETYLVRVYDDLTVAILRIER